MSIDNATSSEEGSTSASPASTIIPGPSEDFNQGGTVQISSFPMVTGFNEVYPNLSSLMLPTVSIPRIQLPPPPPPYSAYGYYPDYTQLVQPSYSAITDEQVMPLPQQQRIVLTIHRQDATKMVSNIHILNVNWESSWRL